MLMRSIMSAAIAAALGLGMGFASAQAVNEEGPTGQQSDSGQTPQAQTGESQPAGEQIGQPSQPDADQAAQQGAQPVPREDEEMSADRSGTRQGEETTGQGQGVIDSGGTAGVQTPAQSADSPADHDTQSDGAGGTGSDVNR